MFIHKVYILGVFCFVCLLVCLVDLFTQCIYIRLYFGCLLVCLFACLTGCFVQKLDVKNQVTNILHFNFYICSFFSLSLSLFFFFFFTLLSVGRNLF